MLKMPKPNLANWKLWLANATLVLGGFLAGGLSATYPPAFMSSVMPQKAQAVAVKTQPIPVDRAVVACTAALAATENLRKDIGELCRSAAKAAPSKATVK